MNSKEKFLKFLQILAILAISISLFVLFFGVIQYLVIALAASFVITGIYALCVRFFSENFKNKISSLFVPESLNNEDKSFENKLRIFIDKAKKNTVISRIHAFISCIADIIFKSVSKFFSSTDLFRDHDSFVEKKFPPKKTLVYFCAYLFSTLALSVIIIQIIVDTAKVASFTLTFLLKAACVILPFIGLFIFVESLFYILNKQKQNLVCKIRSYFVKIDEKENLRKCCKEGIRVMKILMNEEYLDRDLASSELGKLAELVDSAPNVDEIKSIEYRLLREIIDNFALLENDLNTYELTVIKKFVDTVKTRHQAETVELSFGSNRNISMESLDVLSNSIESRLNILRDNDVIPNSFIKVHYDALEATKGFRDRLKQAL